MSRDPYEPRRGITERVNVAGSELVDYVKQLVAEGNVRRLIIRKPGGTKLIEIPLTAGVAVGGALTLLAPVLAALGAMAALIAKFEIDILRSDDERTHQNDKNDPNVLP
ncbi:DUF4342 domain-containing protein [Halochromatium salexigens]|uniref:DUF4342 domain-containing protein n=1 Tax=Halochromatium salexigens TaxID=49447 RepID=A0AAJ0XI42_HALSE|nr:DUF4342 domain-containing protein [Halochromatium salexigens]MBK5932386.1 hypothetical protein [Halochromatium salexigens]